MTLGFCQLRYQSHVFDIERPMLYSANRGKTFQPRSRCFHKPPVCLLEADQPLDRTVTIEHANLSASEFCTALCI